MKKNIILGICMAIALGLLSYLAYWLYDNRVEEKVAETSSPTLPTIAFWVEGYQVNELNGYVDDMNLATTRDTLTPVNVNGNIEMTIKSYGNVIREVTYEVTTLDGKKQLTSGTVEDFDKEKVVLELEGASSNIEETILKVTIKLKNKDIDFYTRIVAYDQLMLKENMDFVSDMHKSLFNKELDLVNMVQYFPSSQGNSGNLNVITNNSNLEEVMWSGLQPQVKGNVRMEVLESTSVFTCMKLSYVVTISSEGTVKEFNVVEFYRTSYSSSTKMVALNQYKRTMEEIFNPNEENISGTWLNLGVANSDIDFKESENLESIAFVREKQLWCYNVESHKITKVFSFDQNVILATGEKDPRSIFGDHDINIIDVEDNGSITFTVYGYMNSGTNEGRVGTAIYSYDAIDNVVIERAFVSSDRAYAIARNELAQGVYYSKNQNTVYIFAQGAIHQINLETKEQEKLSQDLDSSQYVVSRDGVHIAYNNGSTRVESRVTVLNIEENTQYHIDAESGENIYPLGFIDGDIICGYAKATDKKYDQLGNEITPAYALEIQNEERVVVKHYESEGKLIRDISIDERMVVIDLVYLKDGVYMTADEDYITNNMDITTQQVEQSYTIIGDVGQVQVLKLQRTIPEDGIEILNAKIIYNGDALTVAYQKTEPDTKYYVYAFGDMVEEFDKVGEAIKLASPNYGSVIDQNQNYVWRRSARALRYTSSMESGLKTKLKSGMSAMDILTDMAGTNIITYTGASVEQMCYLINKGQVIACRFTDGSWGVFVGYTVDNIYYLNESGSRISTNMNRLDGSVVELVGTGIY